MRISDWSSGGALPISRESSGAVSGGQPGAGGAGRLAPTERRRLGGRSVLQRRPWRDPYRRHRLRPLLRQPEHRQAHLRDHRSEERRVGKVCVRTGKSRWTRYNKKKTKKNTKEK